MGSKARAFKKKDRISSLPDELIHKILSFLDAKVAVQSSVLSKRWKLVWTSMPFLNFGLYKNSSPKNVCKFISHVLSNRNHLCDISEFSFCAINGLPESLVYQLVEYAISHNVEYLDLNFLYFRTNPHKLIYNLSSRSLKKLTLQVILEKFATESDCWDLPALTSLHLVCSEYSQVNFNLSQPFLAQLPALRTLSLDKCNFSRSSFSFNLPHLTTLHLSSCFKFPQTLWNFPALLNLEIDDIILPKNISDVISKLVNLQNLKLIITTSSFLQDHVISCPKLLNLNIKIHSCQTLFTEVKFLAPMLCNFSFQGIVSIWLEAPKLETVNIKLSGWFGDLDGIYREKYCRKFTKLLSRLSNAKFLTFDLESIQVLCAMDFLASSPSPFYNLKVVKLPQGYKESNIPSALRSYLLDGSPGATIVTTLPQCLHKISTLAPPLQKGMLDEPLTAPTNVNSVVDANMGSEVGGPVAGTSDDRASSLKGQCDFGLWQGHKVNSEFVSILDLIMKNYPETFKHFTPKSERFYTMKLNMLCTSVNEFLRTSMNEFNTDIIAEYRDLFADIQRWGFSIYWLVSHLNYIEQLLFSPHELQSTDSGMSDAKDKLQELQTHCLQKIT